MKGCNIMILSQHISSMYHKHTLSQLTVNRTYQRKLVWSLAEKQALIETILKGYPIPLFLVVSRESTQNQMPVELWEIIDGLQRIEAIFSFMNNNFPVYIEGKPHYFDMDCIPGARPLIDKGTLVQKTPKLDYESSRLFAEYELAVSVISAGSAVVEDIFKRINATGRKLSAQCLRHAGVTSKFSCMIQDIASKVRGDYTEENVIRLADMSKLSLSDRGLNYGLRVGDVFWTRHGIITVDGLRRSKDEEIIATLCSCLLHGKDLHVNASVLDSIYDDTSDIFKLSEAKLTSEMTDHLEDLVTGIIHDFDNIFATKDTTYSSWCFKHRKVSNKDLVFIVLFLAIAQLKQLNYVFTDYAKAAELFNFIADYDLAELSNKDCRWKPELRNRLVDRVANKIKKCMTLQTYSKVDRQQILDIIANAATEEQMYDFKLGVSRIGSETIDNAVVYKCLRTLVAMANTKPGVEGHVIIGVADSREASEEHCEAYSCEALHLNNYYITGIGAEAVKLFSSVDKYVLGIKTTIEHCSFISTEIKHQILSTMTVVPCEDKHVLVLSLKTDKPLFYNTELFVRHQSSIKKIVPGAPEYYAVLSQFS